jgi:hypothetical protein
MEGGYFENINKEIVAEKFEIIKTMTKGDLDNPHYVIDALNNAKIKFNNLMNLLQDKAKGNASDNLSITKVFNILDSYYNTLINKSDILKDDYIIVDANDNLIYSNILKKSEYNIEENIIIPGSVNPKPIYMYKFENFEITPINIDQTHKFINSTTAYKTYGRDLFLDNMILSITNNDTPNKISDYLFEEYNNETAETIYNQMLLSDITKIKIQEGYSLISEDYIKSIREIFGNNKNNNIEELCNSLFAFDHTLTILNTPIKSMYNADCIHLFLKLLHHDKREIGTSPDLNREVRLPGDVDSLSKTMIDIRTLLKFNKLETELEAIKKDLNTSAKTNRLGYNIVDISVLIPPPGENELKNKLHKVISTINNLLVPDNNLYKVAKYDSLIELNNTFTKLKNLTIFSNIKDNIKILLYNVKKEKLGNQKINNYMILNNKIQYDIIRDTLDIIGFDSNFKTNNRTILELLLNSYNDIRERDEIIPLKRIGIMFELCVFLKIIHYYDPINIQDLTNITLQDIIRRLQTFFREINEIMNTYTRGEITAEELISKKDDLEYFKQKSVNELKKYLKTLQTKGDKTTKGIGKLISDIKRIITDKPEEEVVVEEIDLTQIIPQLSERNYLDLDIEGFRQQAIQKIEINNSKLDFVLEVYKKLYNNDDEIRRLSEGFLADQCYENIILKIDGNDINYIKMCDSLFESHITNIIETNQEYRERYDLESVKTILKKNIRDNKVGDIIKNYEIESEIFLEETTRNTLKDNIETINRTVDKPLYMYSIDFLLNLVKLLFNIYKTDAYIDKNSEGHGIGTMISYVYLIKYFSENSIFANKSSILASIYNVPKRNTLEKRSKKDDKLWSNIDNRFLKIKFISSAKYFDYIPDSEINKYLKDSANRLYYLNCYFNSMYYNNFAAFTGYPSLQYKNIYDWADCTETAIRNLLNTLIYNEETNQIDPKLLPDTMIPEFKEFFKKYNLDMQKEIPAYLEWRKLFNEIIKENMKKYLTETLEGAERWTRDEFADRVWHYDRGSSSNPQQDMRSNFINFTNVLTLIMYGIGDIQNIISVKYEFDSKNKFIRDSDKLEGIKEICTTKIKNIIETQLTELYTAKILKLVPEIKINFTAHAESGVFSTINIKYLNYEFYSRDKHSDFITINNKKMEIFNVNNLMSVIYKKIHQITICPLLFLNKTLDDNYTHLFKQIFNAGIDKIDLEMDGKNIEQKNNKYIKKVVESLSLYNFNHIILKIIKFYDYDNLNKFIFTLKYSYGGELMKLIFIYIKVYIEYNSLNFDEEDRDKVISLDNQYNYMNILLFDTFIEYMDIYKYVDIIINLYYIENLEENDAIDYFRSINTIILKMKRLTLNLDKFNFFYKIFNFSYTNDSIYIMNQLLCIKNIAKYHADTNNLDKFKIIIDKIVDFNSNYIENLIKSISYFYVLKNDEDPYDLDAIIFRLFIERIKIYKFKNNIYKFDILKLFENYGATIIHNGGTIYFNVNSNDEKLSPGDLAVNFYNYENLVNGPFKHIIYDMQILPIKTQIHVFKDYILNLNLQFLPPVDKTNPINIIKSNPDDSIHLQNALISSNNDNDNEENLKTNYKKIKKRYIATKNFTKENIKIYVDNSNHRLKYYINKNITNIRWHIFNKDMKNTDDCIKLTYQRMQGDRLINIINRNRNIKLPSETERDYYQTLETNSDIIVKHTAIIGQHIAIYAKYIIDELLSVPEELSSYKFYNSAENISRDQVKSNLHKLFDFILISENFNDEIREEFVKMRKFSKEYSSDNFVKKLLDNNSHFNIIKLILPPPPTDKPSFDRIMKEINKVNEYLNKNIEENIHLYYYFKLINLNNYEQKIIQEYRRNTLPGGSYNKNYIKYLKYKKKYILLKNKLNL